MDEGDVEVAAGWCDKDRGLVKVWAEDPGELGADEGEDSTANEHGGSPLLIRSMDVIESTQQVTDGGEAGDGKEEDIEQNGEGIGCKGSCRRGEDEKEGHGKKRDEHSGHDRDADHEEHGELAKADGAPHDAVQDVIGGEGDVNDYEQEEGDFNGIKENLDSTGVNPHDRAI